MALPKYDVWLLNNDFSRRAYLKDWIQMDYSVGLSGREYARFVFDPGNNKIPDMETMRRLLIYRNGDLVFGGIILRTGFTIPNTAPRSEHFSIYAQGYAVYTDWRVILPDEDEEYAERTGTVDDVMKAYVRETMGTLAEEARQIDDVTVGADSSSCTTSVTYQARNIILETVLKNLYALSLVHWRFVPSATGSTFTTYWPIPGLDRSKGNGVNDECIFSIDRKNFNQITYTEDITGHYNHLYILGQGEGVERAIAEGENSSHVTLYGRRERAIDARHITLEESLEDQLPAELQEVRPIKALAVRPKFETWKDTWDLGDIVTIEVTRYGKTYSVDALVVQVDVIHQDDGTETITPILEG